MVAWADDVAVPERDGGRTSAQAMAAKAPVENRPGTPTSDGAAFGSRSLHVSRSGTAVRQAMPDHQGLGPAWQRRLDDRDELTDRVADDRRVEDGWRGAPHGEDSYW